MIWVVLCLILILISEYQRESPQIEQPKEKEPNVFKSKAWLKEWRKVRYRALVRDKGICQCCGITAHDGGRMEVDHCKPKSKYPLISLELDNLATLCSECNRSKSNVDETNWRTLNRSD